MKLGVFPLAWMILDAGLALALFVLAVLGRVAWWVALLLPMLNWMLGALIFLALKNKHKL